jgi:hypothetical protein
VSRIPGRRKSAARPEPVYVDTDDDFAKDPSILQAAGKFHMFYTGAAPGFQGGGGPWRIEYADSPDGLTWTKRGTAFAADDDTWEAGRVQAPSRPLWHDGRYYMFYAGGPRQPVNHVYTGCATSVDLVHWTKEPGIIIRHEPKANDPFVFEEDGTFYLFYTTYDEHEPVFYRTSKDLRAWSEPVRTGADGEGTVVWKADGGYYLAACTGYSGKGETYKLFFSETLTGFRDLGRVDLDVPGWAAGAFGHGDIIRVGGEDRFYFQGTRDGGKTFRIGLAVHKADRNS